MNQIIRIIVHQVMRQLISRGINAGFDMAGEMNQRRKQQNLPPDTLDDYGNPAQPELTREERRQQRQARQQQRQTRQQMKALRKVGRL